jgi:hypothetical protein
MLRLFFGQEPIAVKSAEDNKEPRYGPPGLYKVLCGPRYGPPGLYKVLCGPEMMQIPSSEFLT